MIKLNIKKYLAVIIVIVLIFALHYTGLAWPVESLLSKIFAPLAKSFYAFGSNLSGLFQKQADTKELALELAQAKQTISRLAAENAELKFLEEENSVLRNNLNFLRQSSGHFLMANVISRGGLTTEPNDVQLIVIDKGARDGLFPGLAVVSPTIDNGAIKGVIVGKISQVKETVSEVYLVTNKNCKLAATILGENKTSGIAQGELGLTIRLNFIPQNQNVKIGDLVATSGLEENIKRGLVIGRVAEVIKENNQVWQSAVIEPLLNFGDTVTVAVLLP